MEGYRLHTLRLFIISACLLPFLLVFWEVYRVYHSPLIALKNPPALIRLERSSSAYVFVQRLKQNQYIDSASLFLLIIRLKGYAQHLKAGIYQIHPGETAMQFVSRVVAGDVLTHNFTIISGTTQRTIDQALMKTQDLEYQSKDWQSINKNYPNAEGLLLAETYQYPAGSSSKSLLEQAHQALMHCLDSIWKSRDPNLPFKSSYELLIAASIIEKESSLSQERKLIAGVLINRLKRGMPLQMDPTVIYALEKAYTGKLTHQNLSVDSPYNSYLYRGLPPTPIAMVGKEALMAAAHPQFSNFLYFVAKGDGTHQFSETYTQQRQAIYHYQHRNS